MFVPAILANWTVWPFIQLVNFRFMPLAYRVRCASPVDDFISDVGSPTIPSGLAGAVPKLVRRPLDALPIDPQLEQRWREGRVGPPPSPAPVTLALYTLDAMTCSQDQRHCVCGSRVNFRRRRRASARRVSRARPRGRRDGRREERKACKSARAKACEERSAERSERKES